MKLMQLAALAGGVWVGVAGAVQVCNSNMALTRPDSRYETVAGTTPAGSEVRDRVTGLIWQRCVQGMAWSGSTCTGTATTHNSWMTALELARTATPTTAATVTLWRLPNKTELFSLPERACASPAINATWFPADPGGWAWSSSPVSGSVDGAWYVLFSDGGGYTGGSKGFAGQVRLVRSSQ